MRSLRSPLIIAGAILVALSLLPDASRAAHAPVNSRPGVIGLLSPGARHIYHGVYENAHRPDIGPISLASLPGGRSAVTFNVTYPGHVARRGVARVRGLVRLRVARGNRNGGTVGTVQRAARTTRLSVSGGRVHYAIPLSAKAQRWLHRHRHERGNLVSVSATLGVDVDGDGTDDHLRGAAATMRFSRQMGSRARASSASSSADNTITLELVNATGGPINNISVPVECMYQDGNEGSDLQAFNVVPEAELPAGGTITERVAADGDVFDSPEMMSNVNEVVNAAKLMHLAGDALAELVKDVPLLSLIEEADDLANDCENNASLFFFTAAEANRCPETEGCNKSVTGGWVMSLRENTYRIAPPIDSVTAATEYQWYGGVDGFSPWGINWACPICNAVLENPTSAALYPLALRWLTYMGQVSGSPPCEGERYGELIGDHGLSWTLFGSARLRFYELILEKTGLETGWSGSNLESPLQGNPSWSRTYPNSYCSS